jgi:hypothetical protein
VADAPSAEVFLGYAHENAAIAESIAAHRGNERHCGAETGLEDIDGDVPEEDFWPVTQTRGSIAPL